MKSKSKLEIIFLAATGIYPESIGATGGSTTLFMFRFRGTHPDVFFSNV